MVGSCAGDAQYWSIKRRGNPTSADGEAHTHIKREDGTTESFDFIHNAVVTWDGKTVAITDESGGGVSPRCDGSNTCVASRSSIRSSSPANRSMASTTCRAATRSRGRRTRRSACRTTAACCRRRTAATCTSRRSTRAATRSTTSRTRPRRRSSASPTSRTSLGKADSWSTYFYNGTVFVNGGLNRRGATENRGFEAYAIAAGSARISGKRGRGPTRRPRRSSRRRRSPAYPGPRRVPTRRGARRSPARGA